MSNHEIYAHSGDKSLHCPQDRETEKKLQREIGTLRGDIHYQVTKAIGREIYTDKNGFSQIRRGWLNFLSMQ